MHVPFCANKCLALERARARCLCLFQSLTVVFLLSPSLSLCLSERKSSRQKQAPAAHKVARCIIADVAYRAVYIHMCECMYTYVWVHVYICVSACIHMCECMYQSYVKTLICQHISLQTSIHNTLARACVHAHAHADADTDTHTHRTRTHTHTHTHRGVTTTGSSSCTVSEWDILSEFHHQTLWLSWFIPHSDEWLGCILTHSDLVALLHTVASLHTVT